MNVLGNLGQMYLFILLILLVVGSGFAVWGFIDNISKKLEKSRYINIYETSIPTAKTTVMDNNNWLKLVLFSLIGILISLSLLGFLSTKNSGTTYVQLPQNQMQQLNNK